MRSAASLQVRIKSVKFLSAGEYFIDGPQNVTKCASQYTFVSLWP